MAITLTKVFAGISDYIAKHEANYTLIESNINVLLEALGGSSGSLQVPVGLQEIFDRDGVIGVGSYQLTNQTVVSDTLNIPAGAAWIGLSFRTKSTSTALDTSALTTGTRYIDIDSAGLPSLADTSSANSIYSFSWNSGTKVISAATLLVDILFDGDDYNDMLSSTALATNYTSVAARLEAIENLLGVLGSFYSQDTGTTTGLTFGYNSGVVRNDNVIATTAAGTIALTDASTNYIEVTPSTGVITTNTTGFTTLRVPLFEVTTSGGAITLVTDRRTWAALGGGGGGGSHAQNTDTGTDSASFTLLNTVSGTPSANASLDVERGTSPNVRIRWNETTDQWEFTNDGTVYAPVGAPDLGSQELSKFVTLENPYEAVALTGASSTAGYVKVDLTAVSPFTAIASGVQGMLLRIQFDDSAPDASTVCLIRKIENPAFSPTESMRVFARNSADADDQEGSIILTPGEGLDISSNTVIGFEYSMVASGAGTANLKIFVLGYWDKVTGVGTQDITFSSTGNAVAAATTTQFNLTGFLNRGLIHSVTINETTGNPTTSYDVKFYGKDTFLAADLQYQLDNVDPTAGPPNVVDTLPFFYQDLDGTAELHMSINNKDVTNAGSYDITIRVERFA